MKHLFVINPAAGDGKIYREYLAKLEAFIRKDERQIEYYITSGVSDCEKFVKKTCEENEEGALRIYACGGDGTLNEAVNGAYGFKNVEVACVPTGTGNDFIRNFDIARENFRDIAKQIEGTAVDIDLIRYTQTKEEETVSRYAINMFNIGFDSNAADRMSKIKTHPLVRNSLAYLLGVGITLIKKEGASLYIAFDDGTTYEGDVLLTAVGNGTCCGAGVKGTPLALVDDGRIDVNIVKHMSRLKIISLFPIYAGGKHLSDERIAKLITYKQCKSVIVKPIKGIMKLCIDGEIEMVGEVKFEIIPRAMRFSLPQKEGLS